jgi:lipid-binding SYLF domain-containing protein
MSNEVFAGFNRGPADPNTITMDSFSSNETSSGSGRKKRYRDAYDAASKFKAQTDYKAKQEAKEKEKARAQRATMKIADDISVMEGYTDPGFTVQGQKGSGLLGTVGSAVGGYFGGPLGGQIGGAIGGSF